MTKSPFALPLSIVFLAVSCLIVTGQEQPRHRVVPVFVPDVLRNQSPQNDETLNTNYRVTFSGKSDDKPLGELSSLTCSKDIRISGPLNPSDMPTIFNVSGTLEEKDGLILFSYSIEFRIAIVMLNDPRHPRPAEPDGLGNVQYQDHTSKGTLKMKPGKNYDLLRTGGKIYSIVITPEVEK